MIGRSREEQTPARQVLAILTFTRSSPLALAKWSDGTQAEIPVRKDYVAPTSRLAAHHYLPSLNLVLAVTSEGDHVVCELPTAGAAARADGRPTVYLDQNHWSTLFNARYSRARVHGGERTAVIAIAALAQERKLVLQASFCTYTEATKFTDDVSRYQLGLTVLQLSAGWQLRDPLQVRRTELRKALARFAGQPGTQTVDRGRHARAKRNLWA